MTDLIELLQAYAKTPTPKVRDEILEVLRDGTYEPEEVGGVLWAFRNDPAALSNALNTGIAPDVDVKSGYPALEYWIDELPLEAIAVLIQEGAPVVYVDPGNGDADRFHNQMRECPLICAIKANRPEVVQFMLKEVQPDLQYTYSGKFYKNDNTVYSVPMGGPLHMAANLRAWHKDEPEKATRNETIIQLLLQHGAKTGTLDELQWYKDEKYFALLNEDLTTTYLTPDEFKARFKG
jgi:hypothetical protein